MRPVMSPAANTCGASVLRGHVLPGRTRARFPRPQLEVQPLYVAGPAYREHDGFRIEGSHAAVLSVVEAQIPISLVYALYAADAGDDLDPSSPERLGDPFDTASSSAASMRGATSSNRTRAPKAAKTEASRTPRRRTAHHRYRARYLSHRPDVAVGHAYRCRGRGSSAPDRRRRG